MFVCSISYFYICFYSPTKVFLAYYDDNLVVDGLSKGYQDFGIIEQFKETSYKII